MKSKLFSKKKKVVSLALAVATPFAFVAPAMMSKTVYADLGDVRASTQSTKIEVTSSTGSSAFSFTGYTSKYETKDKTDDGYKLPKPASTSNLVVSVKKSNGDVISESLSPKAGTTNEFYLDKISEDVDIPAGDYIVTYTYYDSSNVETRKIVAAKDFTISIVESFKSTIVFDTNSKYIIPANVVKGDVLKIPFPTASFKGKEIGTLTKDNITITSGSGEEISADAITVNSEDGYISYTIVEDANTSLIITYGGTLTVDDVKYNLTQQKKTVKVVDSRATKELSYSVGSVSLSDVNLKVGKESTLPSPKVIDKNGDEVTDVYTEITVKDDAGVAEVVSDFKFIPKAAGKYTFEYKTVDFAGNKVEANFGRIEATYAANSTITIYATEDYDADKVDDIVLADMVDLTNSIPSKVYVDREATTVNVKLPAIFALSDKNANSYEYLKLTRTIKDKNNADATEIVYEDTNVEGTTTKIKANEAGTVQLTLGGDNGLKANDGQYEVEINYNAAFTKNGQVVEGDKTSTSQTFTLVIERVTTVTAPTLTVDPLDLRDSISVGETVSFSDPTMTDKIGSEFYDESLQVKVSYVYLDGDDAEITSSAVANLNKSGSKYSIDTEEAPLNAAKLRIVYTVSDDAVYQGVTGAEAKTQEIDITLIRPETDTTAPTFGSITWNTTASDKLVLTELNATDGSDGTVSLAAYITDSEGNVVDTLQATTVTATRSYIEGEFTPSSAGDYTVTYVATDRAGNCSVVAQKFTVTITESYSVTIDQIATQEYNDSINVLDYIHLTDSTGSVKASSSTFDGNVFITNENFADEAALEDFCKKMEIANSSGEIIDTTQKYVIVYLYGENSYTIDPTSSVQGQIKTLNGEIKVRAWGIQNGIYGAGSNLVTFSSKDTSAPVFTIANEDLNDTHVDFEDGSATYTLPWFDNITDDGVGVDLSTAKVVWSYQSDSTSHTITYADYQARTADNNPLTITFTKQGKVDVNYSVADKQGNVYNSSTYTIHIGDTDAPVIDSESLDKAITVPSTAKDGGKIVIDLKKIVISEDIDPTSDSLSITIKKDGTEITDYNKITETNVIEVDASEAGEYVISFTATDEAKNKSDAVSKSYTVESPKSTTTNSTTIWGTVLIVVALIILALVIFFFTKSTKTKSKPVELKTDKKKDDNKKSE